ncbi:MAG: ATP-binding protein [Myxococcota bacterium]
MTGEATSWRTFASLALLAFAACQQQAPSQAEAWRQAQQAFVDGRVDAHGQWEALDPGTPEGREARRRRESADAPNRRGIRALEEGGGGARAELAAGVAIAPMNPALYLRLARACRDAGLTLRAAEYYTKYLTVFPDGPRSAAAESELAELDPRLAGVFGSARNSEAREPRSPSPAVPWGALFAGTLFGAALALGGVLLIRYLRGRGMRLDRLVAESPEFHPSVAYLVGSLRHELLKHRIGAAAEAFEHGEDAQAFAFLQERLYEGRPLTEAWNGHLRGFEGALGHRVDLRRDPYFRRADRAVHQIERLEESIRQKKPAALRRLRGAHGRLLELDAYLAKMLGGLARTSVDASLLEDVMDSVRAEHAAGSVELATFASAIEDAADEPILLDVFRVDLALILRNVLRNAILATGEDPAPRHVRFVVQTLMEATGEETVRFEVHDSSSRRFDPEVLFDRRVDRGLGLVAAAVHRYGGTIDLMESKAPFEKCVVVSFFRAD